MEEISSEGEINSGERGGVNSGGEMNGANEYIT
jgi:hypothetical protein